MRELLYQFVYVLLSGFTELLPVSARPHQMVFEMLTGTQMTDPMVTLSIHLGCLLALLFVCKARLQRLIREGRHERLSRRRKNRNIDRMAVLDGRVLKIAAVSMLLLSLFLWNGAKWVDSLWLIAIILVFNGLLLFLPRITARGNKDSRHLSSLDAVALGIGGGLGMIPGISRVGGTLTAGHIAGADRDLVLDMALILSIPMLICFMAVDLFTVITGHATLGFLMGLAYLTMTAIAFGTCYASILIMRYLSSRYGFTSFSYYSWGMALFFFIFYLMI